MIMEFKAPLDGLAKVVTAGVVILDAAVLAIIWHFATTEGPLWPLFLSAVILIGVPLYGFLGMVRAYVVDEGGITVKRVLGSRRIPIVGRAEARILERPRIIRTMGSGGLFGYFGRFIVEGRRVTVYSGRRDRLILIVTGDRAYALGPDDPEGFLETLRTVGLA